MDDPQVFRYIIFCLSYRVDGGVSNNDFIVGLISTLTGKRLDRFQDTETSAFGVAFVAGLQTGSDGTLFRNNSANFSPIF